MLSLPLFFLVAVAAAEQACYYPSGTQTDSNIVPCNNTATGAVHCCAAGDTCISNAFCFGAAQAQIYRGACTDSTFNSLKCPQDCTDYLTDDFAPIWKCPAPYDQDLFWCGANSAKLCQDDATFSWPNGRLMTIAGSSSTSTTSDGSANSTQCETSTTTVVVSGSGNGSSNGSDNATVPVPGKVSWTVALGTGLGVGIPLAMAACAFAFLFLREKKLRKQEWARVAGHVGAAGNGGSTTTTTTMNATRDDRKLLAGNEVYEMYDPNLQEMYVKPAAHEVESPVSPADREAK